MAKTTFLKSYLTENSAQEVKIKDFLALCKKNLCIRNKEFWLGAFPDSRISIPVRPNAQRLTSDNKADPVLLRKNASRRPVQKGCHRFSVL